MQEVAPVRPPAPQFGVRASAIVAGGVGAIHPRPGAAAEKMDAPARTAPE